MGAYLGDDLNIACKIKNIYVGNDNNQARKVIRAYIGDDQNKARLWWNAIKTIYSTVYPNANVSDAGTISTNNGNRSPVTKVNNGDAVVFCVKNCSGNVEGGNWMGTFCVALTEDAARIIAPNAGDNITAHTINGITYWISVEISNYNWGGATDISSPIGIPILQDYFVVDINASPTTEKVAEIINIFGINTN